MADVLSNTMNVADKMNSEQLTEFSSSLLGTFGTLLTPSSQSSGGVRKSQSNLHNQHLYTHTSFLSMAVVEMFDCIIILMHT